MPTGSRARDRRLADLQRLRHEIDAEPDASRRRERIAALLAPSAPWSELGIGVAALVDHVDVPTDAERALLRAVLARCGEDGAADRSAILRTGAVRLLGRQPDRADLDLLLEAARVRILLDGVDVAAELRGLALHALEVIAADVARWVAAELLFDGDVPNQEPHLTAVRILAGHGDHPLLQRWLDGARAPAPVEAAAAAEAELARVMPAREWARRAGTRLGGARALETVAAIEAAVAEGRVELGTPIAEVLLAVADPDLFRAVAMVLAAARDVAFGELLLDLVDDVPVAMLDAYTDAVAVSRTSRRDAVITRISARARAASRGRSAGTGNA